MTEKPAIMMDVSHNNGTIDWGKVRGCTIVDTAAVKATEGAHWDDPLFRTNWRAVLANLGNTDGVLPVTYHYARPDLYPGVKGAQQEAEWHRQVRGHVSAQAAPLALDWEGKAVDLPDEEQAEWIAAWFDWLPTTCQRLLYASRVPLERLHRAGGIPAHVDLWVADWDHTAIGPPDTVPHRVEALPDVVWWQYTSRARLVGAGGNVDLSRSI